MLKEFTDRIWAGLEAIGSAAEPETPESKQKRVAKQMASGFMDPSLDPIVNGAELPSGTLDAMIKYPGLMSTAIKLGWALDEWRQLPLSSDEKSTLLMNEISHLKGYHDYETLSRENVELRTEIELRIIKAGLVVERHGKSK